MPLPWQSPYYASITSPRSLPGLQLWNDAADTSSLVTDTGISLWADKSGNSSVNVLCLNGVNGNYASVADSAAVSVTGPIDMAIRVMLPSWTPASDMVLLEKYGAAGNRSWDFRLKATTGLLAFIVSVDGTAASTGTSSVAPTVSAFGSLWLRVTRDSATGTVTFYTAPDSSSIPSSWSQLGTTAGTTSGAMFDSTNPLTIGADYGGLGPLNGNISQAVLYNGIAGTIACNANFATAAKLAPSFTESSSNAATVTINTSGATGARISGARDLYQGTAANQPILTIAASGNYLTFDGSNDYLKAAAFALAQPETVYMVMSQVSWTLNDVFFDGNATASVRTYQSATTPRIRSRAGATGSELATFPVGTNGVITTVFSGASSLLRYNRTAALTGDFGTDSANGFTLAANGDGSAPANITASEVLVYSGAHDATTQDRVIRYLARKWGIKV